MNEEERAANQLIQAQFGALSHRQALEVGLAPDRVVYLVRSGRWVPLHRGIYASAASPDSPHRRIAAAVLAAGEPVAASHLSAAWMLGLAPRPHGRPHVTVPVERRRQLAGVTVHRSRDFDPTRTVEVKGLPCTDVPRTLTDLAGDLPEDRLTPILDAALARRLTTVGDLENEIRRRSAQGRIGPGRLAALLRARGLAGGPAPSVLEAEMLRLLARWRIPVLAREIVHGRHGQYRVDFVIVAGLVVEVDGFAYHWSPEAKAHDDRRRNELRAGGLFVLVYSWRDVRRDGRRVAGEIRAEVAKRAA